MNFRSYLAMVVATLFAVSAAAQCAMEKTQHVPAAVLVGPIQDCGGFTFTVPGVQLNVPPQGCPLWVIFTPPHEIAAPSTLETRVKLTGATSAITMTTFSCAVRWAFIIPIGSHCVVDQSFNQGAVQHLVTEGCYGPQG